LALLNRGIEVKSDRCTASKIGSRIYPENGQRDYSYEYEYPGNKEETLFLTDKDYHFLTP
jgi:hypothetical protein